MGFRSTLLVLSILSISLSLSSAQVISGGILGGVLTCTNTSISTAGTYSVIPQAKVDLVCGNGSLAKVLKSAVTNTAGVYSFVLTTLDTTLLDPAKCYLNVTVPTTSCIFGVPGGLLRIPIVLLTKLDVGLASLLVFVPGALSYILPV